MLRRIISSGTARAAGALAGVLLGVVVGRQLGADGAGQFFYALTLLTLTSKITRWGYPFYLLRHTGSEAAPGEAGDLAVVYWRGMLVMGALCLVAGTVGWLAADFLASRVLHKPYLAELLPVFALALLPFTLVWFNAAWLKAHKQPEWANLVESGLIALAAMGLVLVLGVHDALGMSRSYLMACILVVAGSLVFIVGRTPWPGWSVVRSADVPWGLGYGASTTVVAVSNYLVQYAPFLVLGRFAGDGMLGAFSVAQRAVMAVNMLNLVVGSVYFPHFADLWQRREAGQLRRMYRTTVLIQVGGSLPVVALMAVRPDWVLGIFGEGFAPGAPSLMILAVGYWLSMFFGPSEGALLMFGEADSLRNAAFWVLLVELGAVALLVPTHLDVATAAITTTAYLARRLWARVLVERCLRRLEEPA